MGQDPALKQAFAAIPALREATHLSPKKAAAHLSGGDKVR